MVQSSKIFRSLSKIVLSICQIVFLTINFFFKLKSANHTTRIAHNLALAFKFVIFRFRDREYVFVVYVKLLKKRGTHAPRALVNTRNTPAWGKRHRPRCRSVRIRDIAHENLLWYLNARHSAVRTSRISENTWINKITNRKFASRVLSGFGMRACSIRKLKSIDQRCVWGDAVSAITIILPLLFIRCKTKIKW